MRYTYTHTYTYTYTYTRADWAGPTCICTRAVLQLHVVFLMYSLVNFDPYLPMPQL